MHGFGSAVGGATLLPTVPLVHLFPPSYLLDFFPNKGGPSKPQASRSRFWLALIAGSHADS
jgi:hypothetical protein